MNNLFKRALRAAVFFLFIVLMVGSVFFFKLPHAFAQNPPTVPTNLTVTTVTSSTISLAWMPSTDSGGTLAGYKIYRNGNWLITLSPAATTWFRNRFLAPNTSYNYTVLAYDTNGNMSGQSNSVTGQTLPSTPSIIGNNEFGISVGTTLLGLDPNTLNADLNNIASLGITWIRFDMEWSDVQPISSAVYNWGNFDTFISAALAHHFKLLAVLDYTPFWAQTPGCALLLTNTCPPAQMSQFGAYAKAVAQRYTPQGMIDYEIWNEPNTGGSWAPAANANAYEVLLQSAYTAIHGVDPSAGVITGGMAPAVSSGGNVSQIDFLSQLYAAGGKSYFDAIGMHPYTEPAMPSYYAPWNAWSEIANTTPSLRSIMTANGDSGRRIWMTEYGATTGGPGVVETSTQDTHFNGAPDHVTEPVQAAMIAQAVTMVRQDTWSGPLFFYGYQDKGTSQSTTENFFGILRFDGSQKPAHSTIQNILTS